MQAFAVEQVADEHLEKEAVRDDAYLAGMLIGKECQCATRPFLQVVEILFVRIAVRVIVVCPVHLVDDTDDVGIVAALADYLAWIPAFLEEFRIDYGDVKVLVDDSCGFPRALIRTRDYASYREARKIAADARRLPPAVFGEPAVRALADIARVQYRFAMAHEIETPRPHEQQDRDSDDDREQDGKKRPGLGEDDRERQHDLRSITDVLHL